MPYLVVCPKCSAKLKTGTPVPAGRSVSCPQCKLQFTLEKPAVEIEGTGPTPVMATKPAGPPAPPKPAPRASSETASTRKGREADEEEIPSADIVDAADFDFASKPKTKRRRDEDEDERPRSRSRRDDDDDRPAPRKKRNEDEEEERPKSRSRREDDEERPKSRSRRDDDEDERPAPRRKREDDEEDERPKARKGRVADDDDEDERPKSRKSRADDDDEDDGPRPKSRKGKKNKNVLLIALIGGGVAFIFLLCLGVELIFAPLGLYQAVFGGDSSEMLAWAPADSQNIIYMDVEGMEKIDAMKGNFKGDITDSTKLGLKQDEVSAVMGAGRIVGGGDPDVTIIKLRTKVDQQKLISTSGGKEATANSKKYYKTTGGGALYFASDKLLVVTKTDAVMTSLLQKDSGKVVISDDLKSAAKRGDGLMWVAATGQSAEKGDLIGIMSGNLNFGGLGPAAPKSKCKSTLMSMKASGTQGTSRIESSYDSSDTAKKIADDLKKAMDLAKAKSNDGNTFDVSSSGSTVTLTITGPIKPGKGMIPGLPGF